MQDILCTYLRQFCQSCAGPEKNPLKTPFLPMLSLGKISLLKQCLYFH